MNPVHTNESQQTDPLLKDIHSEAKPVKRSGNNRLKKRLARIADYELDSLAKEDSLEANVGAHNSGLMRIGLYYENAINKSLQAASNVNDISQLRPAITTHVTISRQIERFANFQARLAELQRHADGQARSDGNRRAK